jgi:molybdopterin-guanine dinucleotide biosynthesis protein A
LRIAGVIIAGGEGLRLGGRKVLAPFGGDTLLGAAIASLAPQTDVLALNLKPEAADEARARYSYPILHDAPGPALGPLGGLLAALDWARDKDMLLATIPADTPFLPGDLLAQLAAASRADVPVFARDAQRDHYLCALWPAVAIDVLHEGVSSGRLRSVRSAHDALGSVACRISGPRHAFFNVNTQEDLARAEEILRQRA